MMSPTNHLIRINIFCSNYDLVRGIANHLNQTFADGMLAHIDWAKMVEMYKIKKEEAIGTWQAFLT